MGSQRGTKVRVDGQEPDIRTAWVWFDFLDPTFEPPDADRLFGGVGSICLSDPSNVRKRSTFPLCLHPHVRQTNCS